MKCNLKKLPLATLLLVLLGLSNVNAQTKNGFVINDQEYLEYQSVNVMLAHDFYPEGHQGGVGVIQNGLRTATNGDLRLEPTPGQWQPVPKVGTRIVDKENQLISVRMEYPDSSKNRKGFNPVIYPDLNFSYYVRVQPAGKSFKIIVDLEKPLPAEWIGKVGFNFELFPGILFGKSYYIDNQTGIFNQQVNGPVYTDNDGELQITPMGAGRKLTIAPETPRQTMIIENKKEGNLELLDGRGKHNNGWFVVRSLVPAGATKNAIEWLVTPNAVEGWISEPVIQMSQVGYHPKQQKVAVIELDAKDLPKSSVSLMRISENGGFVPEFEAAPKSWGKFLRYNYLQFDFTKVERPGMYVIKYGDKQSEPFKIGTDVFKRHVWQPTVEYFLPVQMCHMRVNERYRVWHDFCHLDDARMAPTDLNHFDGYLQGSSTLTKYKPGDLVPGLNRGGWHDAGDFDLRVESQAETVRGLALAYEEFGEKYDNTRINQSTKVVDVQVPDGKADILQQAEHGLITIVAGYQSLGRLYRGIIAPTLQQYVLLGDATAMTDNVFFKGDEKNAPAVGLPGSPDDRWVFTEENPRREIHAAACLAAGARVMRGFNDTLAQQSLQIAEAIWNNVKIDRPVMKVEAAVELFIATKNKKYSDFLLQNSEAIVKAIEYTGYNVGRVLPLINNKKFTNSVREAVKGYQAKVAELEKKTPYGVPYEPSIWGAGWGIQNFGFKQYFLHSRFPDIFPETYMMHAMNFVLGTHPGSNNSSFASGVGSHSATVGYGLNRADWSYIPGGIVSGTALIRPDFPELLVFPYLWQQTEYVLGGGTTDYLFLVLAADHLLSKK